MNVQIVSTQRRWLAFTQRAPEDARRLGRRHPLIEALAEHRFPDFRDHRTPAEATLRSLLEAIRAEHHEGHLIFEDLGALFWELLLRYPAVDFAYRARYPVVIADEHQDASALQDAIVRRLASQRMTILADPMQLIHGFRGADLSRLERHLTECDRRDTLSTPHRWRGNPRIGEWLLAVRNRLETGKGQASRPDAVTVVLSPGQHGFAGTLNPAKLAVLSAYRAGLTSVAVLAWRNDEVSKIQSYLSRQGLYPRQVSSSDDFEEARLLIEELPPLESRQRVAVRALSQLRSLAPTMPSALIKQVERRLGPQGVDKRGGR